MPKKQTETLTRRRVQRLVRRLPDCKIAILFMYLSEKGLPQWAQGSAKKQASALAMLTGWNGGRALQALDAAVQAGYATTPNERGQARREQPKT